MKPSEIAAANCKRFRQWNGYEQAELAALMSELGERVHQTAISKIEVGLRKITVDELVAMCAIFAVAPEDMLIERPSWRIASGGL